VIKIGKEEYHCGCGIREENMVENETSFKFLPNFSLKYPFLIYILAQACFKEN
jgi:hypothetical protein